MASGHTSSTFSSLAGFGAGQRTETEAWVTFQGTLGSGWPESVTSPFLTFSK